MVTVNGTRILFHRRSIDGGQFKIIFLPSLLHAEDSQCSITDFIIKNQYFNKPLISYHRYS